MKTLLTTFVFFAFSFLSAGSELFVKVNSQTSYYAIAGMQTHNNNNGTFRFFDLSPGNITLSIFGTNTNNLFYTGSIYLEVDQRVICELDNYGKLQILKREKIVYYNWYTSTSTDMNSGNITPNNGNVNYANQDAAFPAFLQLLKEDAFDSGKLEKAKRYCDKTALSVSQIGEINSLFSFDGSRLEWTKYAYKNCYDKQNYFLLKKTFSFATTYTSLEEFIDGK
ncbi:MAG: DUF4476 domain-containing protein [Bacteroidota bacterium]